MPRFYSDHQRIMPDRFGQNALAYLVGLREAHVVQIIVQPLDLLRQRYLEETDVDFGLILAALREQGGKTRRCDAIGQGNTQLAMVAVGRRAHAAAYCASYVQIAACLHPLLVP